MYTRAQKTPYEIDFVCHSNNFEGFPFLDLSINCLWGLKVNLENWIQCSSVNVSDVRL
jgi:hypothetical protein